MPSPLGEPGLDEPGWGEKGRGANGTPNAGRRSSQEFAPLFRGEAGIERDTELEIASDGERIKSLGCRPDVAPKGARRPNSSTKFRNAITRRGFYIQLGREPIPCRCTPLGYTLGQVIHTVELSRDVLRQLRRVPKHIVAKLMAWVDDVEARGLEAVRKIPGYNDHPLKGELAGKRAIRLSQQWRAVYVITSSCTAEFVLVEEVHPHDY